MIFSSFKTLQLIITKLSVLHLGVKISNFCLFTNLLHRPWGHPGSQDWERQNGTFQRERGCARKITTLASKNYDFENKKFEDLIRLAFFLDEFHIKDSPIWDQFVKCIKHLYRTIEDNFKMKDRLFRGIDRAAAEVLVVNIAWEFKGSKESSNSWKCQIRSI